jgi:uncharacterized protein (DUF58 family)
MPTLTPVSLIILAGLSICLGVSYPLPPLLDFTLAGFAMAGFFFIFDFVVTPAARNLEIRREIMPQLSLGDENEVRLVVANHRRQAVRGIIGDNVPEAWQLRDVIWRFRLKGGQKGTFGYTITPQERGAYTFEHCSLRIFGSLGLINKSYHVPLAETVKVYPSYLQIRKYQIHAHRNNLDVIGKRRQRQRGEGREFESLRDYTRNDEYKKINWKATARRGKPIVSQYQIERNQNIIIAIDAGRMMRTKAGKMAKLDYAVNAALMLSFICVHKEDNVGLLVFNSKVTQFLPPKRGKAQLARINEALYNVQFEFSEPNYRDAFYFLKRKVSRRSLVVLLTDIIDDRASDILLREFTRLYPQHLPLSVTLADNLLKQVALQVPGNTEEMLELGVAQMLLDERLKAISYLKLHGALTLDTNPENVTVDAINKYLDIKARSLI